MKYEKNPEEIIINVAVREELINRVEVLDKVKQLLLIPGMQFTTAQGVADFYDVDVANIKTNIVKRHRAELESDGMIVLSRKDVLERYCQNDNGVTKYKSHIEIPLSDGSSINIGNGKNLLFTRRSVLRIGMLLRDSEVAMEVRTQLLNIEEKVAPEVKVTEIDKEMELLQRAVGAAFMNNDIDGFITAMQDLRSYNNRYNEESFKALEEENFDLKKTIAEMGDLVKSLQLTNRALSEEISTVATVETYRRVIISMMIRLAEKKQFSTPYLCYQQLYTILRNDYEIDLTGRRYSLNVYERKQKSKIDCIETKEEWNKALKVATAMCNKDNVTIDDLLLQLDRVSESNK